MTASEEGIDYRWQWVTCSRCRRSYTCTPTDDFYEPAPEFGWTKGRVCDVCLLTLALPG